MTNESKFNGKSLVYSKFRPDYPDQLLNDLIIENKLNEDSLIADIGSGTGIMTKKLLELGFKVFAVEPNEEMRKVANDNLKNYNHFISINGTAENTTLNNNSVDLMVVAQAFHWFDVLSFQKECQRILKSNGRVAIIANERVTENIINIEIADTYKKFCPNFKGFSNGLMDSSAIYDSFYKEGYSIKTYDNPLIYNKSNFIGRHLSSSFSLTKGDEFYPMFVEELSNIFERHNKNGFLTLPNVTKYWSGVVKQS